MRYRGTSQVAFPGRRTAATKPTVLGSLRSVKAAAELSESSPADAFDALYPRGRSLISGVGPAFFTKFLYFAGAGAANPLLDPGQPRRAAALNQSGRTSLSTRGPWPADTYARYCTLLSRWAGQLDPAPQRTDLFERWLFDQGALTDSDGFRSYSPTESGQSAG